MRAAPIATAVLAATLLASCASVQTQVVDSNPAIDFTRLRTYSWGPRGGASSADVDRQIERAIDAQLRQHGLVRVQGQADLEVRFHASVNEEKAEQIWGAGRGPRWAGYLPDTHISELAVGSIVVDVLEYASKELAWRGAGQGELSADASSEERARQIDEGAASLFANFPRTR